MSYNYDHSLTVPAFVLGLLLGIGIMGMLVTFDPLGLIAVREAAVKAGKAEYYLDKENVRQWRWKP